MAEGSDSDQERNLAATPRRLEQAREEGQVARSRSLSNAAVLGAAATVASFGGASLFDGFRALMQNNLRFSHDSVFDSGAMLNRLAGVTWQGLLLTMPALGVLLIIGMAAPLALGGWLFSLKPVTPAWSKLNPLAGLGKLFSVKSFVEVFKVMFEALLVAGTVGWFMWAHAGDFNSLVLHSNDGGVGSLGRLLMSAFVYMTVALVATAALDVPLQLFRHTRQLRMTLEEVKREARESEGDPQLKAKIRSQQREIARRRMMSEVPKADVVITNPTHYAVALRYDESAGGAPRVVAKGMNLVAQAIRALAAEHAVPTLEAPPLARSLYRHTELGDPIPQALYGAVAQVLAYVYGLRASVAAGRAGPPRPLNIEVPPELDGTIDPEDAP